MEYCDVICCNVSSLWLLIKGGIQKHKMLMPMKEFSEVLGVCKRGGWSLETLQQLSAECKFPPLRIPSTASPIQNSLHCKSAPEFATQLVSTSTMITCIWLFIHLKTKRFPETPKTPERKRNPTLCKVLKTPVDATSSRC